MRQIKTDHFSHLSYYKPLSEKELFYYKTDKTDVWHLLPPIEIFLSLASQKHLS
jgi:hypothetical protein